MTDNNMPEDKKVAKRAYVKAWKKANPDKVRSYAKVYRERNKDKARAYNDAYRAANPDKVRAWGKSYREANKDKTSASNKARYAANPDKNRNRKYLRNYGITLQDYEDMYIALGGHCQICGGYQDRLAVDHRHDTGEVRGLLCTKCNAGIGALQDDQGVISRALAYVGASA